MTAEKQNKMLSFCASLALHLMVAAILIFSLSGNVVIPRDLGKLNLMWVSFAAIDKNSFLPAKENNTYKTQSKVTRTITKPETSAKHNFQVGSETIAQPSEAISYDKTIVSSETKAVAYTAVNIHHNVSSGGRAAMTEGVVPAFSNAYPLYRETPRYPEMARQQGHEGVVLVEAEILADGRVGKTIISKSSGYADLDQAAINAAKAHKFEPAKKSGIPCKTRAEMPFRFVLNESNSQS